MPIEAFPDFIRTNYELYEFRHATAILQNDFPDEWEDIVQVLVGFRLRRSHITMGGGRKSPVAGAIDSEFYNRGWVEKAFATGMVVDQQTTETPTHKVDCFKNRIALEVEWNNKDPFYDRDLNNFGVLVTRSDELQEIFKEIGRASSFGASTTHMGKLLPRIEGGGGGGCPLLAVGIKRSLYVQY